MSLTTFVIDRVVGRLIATVFLFLVLMLRNPYALGMQVRENQDIINNAQDRYTGDDDVVVTDCAHFANSSETTKRSPGERRCKQRHELESGSVRVTIILFFSETFLAFKQGFLGSEP